MSPRPGKIAIITATILAGFLIVYFNQEISIFFLDPKSFNGLLFAVIAVYEAVRNIQKHRIKNLIESNAEKRQDNEYLRRQLYEKTKTDDLIKEGKAEILNEIRTPKYIDFIKKK